MRADDPTCSSVALYGSGGDLDLSGCLDLATSLFDEFGITPDALGVVGRGFSGKAAAFGPAQDRLKKKGFDGVGALDVFAAIQGYKQIAFEWRVAASLNRDAGAVVFAFDQSLRGHDPGYFDNLVLRFRERFAFKYGIAYQRPLSKGPVLFAYGMSAGLGYGPEDMREADRIAKWLHDGCEKNSHLAGALRDVFAQNWLTALHLSVPVVGGMNLIEWIASSPTRGTLRRPADDVWSWSLSPEQEDSVRATLRDAGRLICP
jgi:hypothetical protein